MSFNSVWNNKVKHSGALFIINLDVHYVWNKVVKLNSHTSGKKKKKNEKVNSLPFSLFLHIIHLVCENLFVASTRKQSIKKAKDIFVK